MTHIPSSSPAMVLKVKPKWHLSKHTLHSIYSSVLVLSLPPINPLTFVKDNSCKNYFHHFFYINLYQTSLHHNLLLSLCLHVFRSPQKAQGGHVNTYGIFWEEGKSSIHTTCSWQRLSVNFTNDLEDTFYIPCTATTPPPPFWFLPSHLLRGPLNGRQLRGCSWTPPGHGWNNEKEEASFVTVQWTLEITGEVSVPLSQPLPPWGEYHKCLVHEHYLPFYQTEINQSNS